MGLLQSLACLSALASLAVTAVLPLDKTQLTSRDDACSNGAWAPPLAIGGSSGDGFCETRLSTSGEVISGIEVWWDDTGIKGIVFTYSLGEASTMYGSSSSPKSQSITIAPGELVQIATLWGDGTGDHLGHIYLKTDKQKYDVGRGKSSTQYNINVGGGLLIGAFGINGQYYISELAWLFLEAPIDSISIGGIKFGPDPTGTSTNIEPSYLFKSTMGNNASSTGNVSFTASGSEAVTQSTERSQSTTGTFGASATVSVDGTPFGIGVSASGSCSWSVSHTSENSATSTDQITISQTAGPISLAPGHGKACEIFYEKGNGNFPYTSTVTINLKGGQTVSYPEAGTLISVQYSSAVASCANANNPADWDSTTSNPPPGVAINS